VKEFVPRVRRQHDGDDDGDGDEDEEDHDDDERPLTTMNKKMLTSL
jgi:hypothetical protein